MMINGTDVTLYLAVAATVAVLAWLEYIICRRAKNPQAKKLLLFVPFLVFCRALFVYGTSDGSGFLDLSGIVVFLIICYGMVCLAAIGLGWFIALVKTDKETKAACPFADENSGEE